MKADLYQHLALEFFEKGHRHHDQLSQGLVEEASEVRTASYIGNSKEVIDELGDVLWYVAIMADQNGSSLEEIMKLNYYKLEDRKINGKK